MKNIITLIIALLFSMTGMAQNKPAYVLYNSKGKKVSYGKMLKSFKRSEVILFGEYHDNPIAHWLELELTKDLHKDYQLTLGAEMIEADDQRHLNNYLNDVINEIEFDTLARLWNNYSTDYRPLVDFARDSNLKFIATNIPRRHARTVARGGFEALDTVPATEKAFMAPLPIAFDSELETYKNMLTMMGDHGSPNVVKAQAIKDATMAHNIMKYVPARKRFSLKAKVDQKFLHFNGAYHSDYYEGINWYIQQINKKTRISTISTVMAADPTKLPEEHKGKADFIICVDEDMTRTY